MSHYKLPSGNTYYANNHIIGIDPNGNLSEGYDGDLSTQEEWLSYEDWSEEDLHFIADMMIKRWMDFKKSIPKLKEK